MRCLLVLWLWGHGSWGASLRIKYYLICYSPRKLLQVPDHVFTSVTNTLFTNALFTNASEINVTRERAVDRYSAITEKLSDSIHDFEVTTPVVVLADTNPFKDDTHPLVGVLPKPSQKSSKSYSLTVSSLPGRTMLSTISSDSLTLGQKASMSGLRSLRTLEAASEAGCYGVLRVQQRRERTA